MQAAARRATACGACAKKAAATNCTYIYTDSKGQQQVYDTEIKAKAANDHDRLEADKMLASLEASKQVILQAQRDPVERWVRIGFALPFLVFNAKLIIWDKLLELLAPEEICTRLWNAWNLHGDIARNLDATLGDATRRGGATVLPEALPRQQPPLQYSGGGALPAVRPAAVGVGGLLPR